jgi:lipoprotein-anchoring transpeptidase ErfK/SrfK
MLIGKVVVSSVAARKWPSPNAPVIATFPKVNPQGATQVFDLEGSVLDSGGVIWFRALLPIRPNGTSGYIPAGSVRILQTSYRVVVNREKLRLTLWDGCRQVMKFKIGLGKESTPTPNGDFYIVSLLKPPLAGSVYGKYAYGLSAFSNAITDWRGGGVIGLHGTNDPSSIGNRKSHGCIRMYNWDISKLVRLLPLGTPVEIR